MAARNNPTLFDDIINEILVRLPVKSLLRFQSVSKTWLSLIKDPAFVKSQLLHATTVETDQTLIMNRCQRYEDNKISLFHVDSRQIVGDLNFPYSRGAFSSILVGSANGIVCVYVDFDKHTNSIYLWNPAIRQFKVIPSYSVCYEPCGALGFGYDPIDRDFKVVRVVALPSAEVYSANKNVWRKLPDPIDFPYYRDFDVCVNGFLCGIGYYGMMTFDVNKEELNCAIKLPAFISDDNQARIIEFHNSVAVIILIEGLNDVHADQRLDRKTNIWMLNDDACLCGDGVEASWTPMFSIDLGMPAQLILRYLSNKDLLLLTRNDVWISCNGNNKDAKVVPLLVEIDGFHCNQAVYKYTESLVSLAGFKQVNWNADEDYN